MRSVRLLALLVALVVSLVSGGSPLAADSPLKLGVLTPLDRVTWSQVHEAWRQIEALGFDSAWVNDHLYPPDAAAEPQLEAWTALAALAATTKEVDVGVLVTGNTYRNPALLAKMATTVDQISGGRALLGIGASWFKGEHEAYGFPYGTARERAERLAESLQVISTLWSGGGSFAGEHYSLEKAPFSPPNLRAPRPPIIVGGQGKQWIVPLVGQYADGWNAAPSVTPDGFRERVEIIREACAKARRAKCPSRFSKVLRLKTISEAPLPTPARPQAASWVLAGTPKQIASRVGDFVEAGANEIILMLPPPYDLETLRRFSSEVVPLLPTPAAASPAGS